VLESLGVRGWNVIQNGMLHMIMRGSTKSKATGRESAALGLALMRSGVCGLNR